MAMMPRSGRARWATTWWLVLAIAGTACGPHAAPTAERSPAPAPGAAAAASAGAPAPERPLEPLKVAFAADSAVYAPMFIAIEKGYFADEGLAIEIVKAGGGGATPALLSGDLQYSTSAASALSAMLLGAPLKIIYTNADRTDYELWSTTPEVRALADVVGKTIGVQSRGDTMEIAVRMALQQEGIDPDAVSYVSVGV